MDTTLHMMTEPLSKAKADSDAVALSMHVVVDPIFPVTQRNDRTKAPRRDQRPEWARLNQPPNKQPCLDGKR